jgi:hypothetical protein
VFEHGLAFIVVSRVGTVRALANTRLVTSYATNSGAFYAHLTRATRLFFFELITVVCSSEQTIRSALSNLASLALQLLKGITMKYFNTNLMALAIGLAISAGALAEGMSKPDYKAGKDKISAELKADKAACASFSGNAKDICVVEAKGKGKIARAELEAAYEPTERSHYKLRMVKAESAYDLAKEKCSDVAGNVKDVCKKEAKAALVAAKADAKVQIKTQDANTQAEKKTSEARSEASTKVNDARNEAATDKNDAQYKVEKEKCDALAGNAKDSCLSQAKTRFGK